MFLLGAGEFGDEIKLRNVHSTGKPREDRRRSASMSCGL
jgi:hypothetical protein